MLLTNIRALCEKKNITLCTLEKKLGFGNGTISRWSTSSPSIDKVMAVADYFHVTLNYLVKARGDNK